jgi:hypothetical protein
MRRSCGTSTVGKMTAIEVIHSINDRDAATEIRQIAQAVTLRSASGIELHIDEIIGQKIAMSTNGFSGSVALRWQDHASTDQSGTRGDPHAWLILTAILRPYHRTVLSM